MSDYEKHVERYHTWRRKILDAAAEPDHEFRMAAIEALANHVAKLEDTSYEVAALKAELAKRDEPLTDEQAEQAFAIAKADGVGECDTLALGMQGIDAAIRRVRGES